MSEEKRNNVKRIQKTKLTRNVCDYKIDCSKDCSTIILDIISKLNIGNMPLHKQLTYYNAMVQTWIFFKRDITLYSNNCLNNLCECLKNGLLSHSFEIRASCLKVLRYFSRSIDIINKIYLLKIDYLIIRSLDLCINNEVERMQAVRLIHILFYYNNYDVPSLFIRSLISIAIDGAEYKDKLYLACIALLCEFALLNFELVKNCGGISCLMKIVSSNSNDERIDESILHVLLQLYNSPQTRKNLNLDLNVLFFPFTNINMAYIKQEQELMNIYEILPQKNICKFALSVLFKSWPGIFYIFNKEVNSLKSLFSILSMSNVDSKADIIDIFFEAFDIPIFNNNELSDFKYKKLDICDLPTEWKLSNGFIVEETKCIFPFLSRPNLLNFHKSILLYGFANCGLFEALINGILSDIRNIAVKCSILLSELLYLHETLLPNNLRDNTHLFTKLIFSALNKTQSCEIRRNAMQAVIYLKESHEEKFKIKKPISIFLNHLCNLKDFEKSDINQLYLTNSKYLEMIGSSKVLYTKDPVSWVWQDIAYLVESYHGNWENVDENHIRWLQRLALFFQPSNMAFSKMNCDRIVGHMLLDVAFKFMPFLVDISHQDEAEKIFKQLLGDLNQELINILDKKKDMLFTTYNVESSACQFYFIWIGQLSSSSKGDVYLEKSAIYETLLKLVKSKETPEILFKLIISTFNYSNDASPVTILKEALKSPSIVNNIYAIDFLRVLMVSNRSIFNKICVPLLISNIKNDSNIVRKKIVCILTEACNFQDTLSCVWENKNQLELNNFDYQQICIQFLCSEEYLASLIVKGNNVDAIFTLWLQKYNEEYVYVVEEMLMSSLTTYECSNDGKYARRSNKIKSRNKEFLLPHHLCYHLGQHKLGLQVLQNNELYLKNLTSHLINHHSLNVLNVKKALWALGNLGSSELGFTFLKELDMVHIIVEIAMNHEILTLRGTAIYCICLLANSSEGRSLLEKYGWISNINKSGFMYNNLTNILNFDVNSLKTNKDFACINVDSLLDKKNSEISSIEKSFIANVDVNNELILAKNNIDPIQIYHKLSSNQNEIYSTNTYVTESKQFFFNQDIVSTNSSNSEESTMTVSNTVPKNSVTPKEIHKIQQEMKCPIEINVLCTNLSNFSVCDYRESENSSLLGKKKYLENSDIKHSSKDKDLMTETKSKKNKLMTDRFLFTSLDENLETGTFNIDSNESYWMSADAATMNVNKSDFIWKRRTNFEFSQMKYYVKSFFEPKTSEYKSQTMNNRNLSRSVSDHESFKSRLRRFSFKEKTKKLLLKVSSDGINQNAPIITNYIPNVSRDVTWIKNIQVIALPFDVQLLFAVNDDNYLTGEVEILKKSPLKNITSEDWLLPQIKTKYNQDNMDKNVVRLKKDIFILISQMANAITNKSAEQSLLQLKQQHNETFRDFDLYCDVAEILGEQTFRLMARRFIQELFLDLAPICRTTNDSVDISSI